MSGKKQHHIPQFLQRGFLFDVKAEKTDAHRRKGVSPLASIADVAGQRFFYSRLSSDGSKTLDDKITRYENRLGGLLIKLRAIPVDEPLNAALAAEVIAHLTPRIKRWMLVDWLVGPLLSHAARVNLSRFIGLK